MPLDLFRGRNYSVVMTCAFVLGFGMFTSVIYLPRFYQIVRGVSATASGYEIWPLLVGLMGGSILAGQLISRFGRYKLLLLASPLLLIAGSALLTRLTDNISNTELWAFMLLLGLGIGPGMAGYTVVAQSSVPLNRIGVATSALTFFRQIGGSVGLALAGTLFNSTFTTNLPARLHAHQVPQQLIDRFNGNAASGLTSAGNLASTLGKQLPAPLHPFIPGIVAALHEAMSESIAVLFWLTLGAGVLTFLVTIPLREQPLQGGPSSRREQRAAEMAAAGPDEELAKAG